MNGLGIQNYALASNKNDVSLNIHSFIIYTDVK